MTIDRQAIANDSVREVIRLILSHGIQINLSEESTIVMPSALGRKFLLAMANDPTVQEMILRAASPKIAAFRESEESFSANDLADEIEDGYKLEVKDE